MAMAAMQPMTIPAMAPPESPLLELELELEGTVVACGVEEAFEVVVVGCEVVVAGLGHFISIDLLI